MLADVENAHDVLMRHPARHLHLAPEQVHHAYGIGVAIEPRAKQCLQRDRLFQVFLQRLVDFAHAARANESLDDETLGDSRAFRELPNFG